MNKWIVTGVAAVIVIILLSTSLFIVKEGEYRALLRFGEVTQVYDDPGLHFKVPFIESTLSLPKYQKIYDSQPASILTKDQKPLIVDNYTVWRIVDSKQFLKTLRTVEYAEQRIDNLVYSVVRRKLSEIEYGGIISENTARGDLNDEITEEVAATAVSSEYGIKIVDVRIRRTDLPPENKESVYNRMISDRQSIASRYLAEGDEQSRIITAGADREAIILIAQAQEKAKVIVAEGEQEAARIYNEAYGADPEFYNLYRTLESYVTTFENEPVIMLPIESPYARILLGTQ